MTIKFRINTWEQRKMFKGEMEIRTSLSQRQKGKKAWNFTTRRTKRTNASWGQHMLVLSHLVLWEDVGMEHAVVNHPNSNKKLSSIFSYISLSTFKVNLWDVFATGQTGTLVVNTCWALDSLCRSVRIMKFTYVWTIHLFIFSEITADYD